MAESSYKGDLITKIDEIFGFNLSNSIDGVDYNFGQYKLNQLYKPLVKLFVNEFSKFLDSNDKAESDQIVSLFLDFYKLYYYQGDFGYFKSKYSSFKYKVPYGIDYSGKDTEFRRASKDCYYVKTADIVNEMDFQVPSQDLTTKDVRIQFFKTEDYNNEGKAAPLSVEVKKNENEETGELLGYNIYIRNFEGDRAAKPAKEKIILDEMENYGIQTTPGLKSTLSDFLSKRGRDYFIHKRLKDFLRGELERYLFQVMKGDTKGKINVLEVQNKINEIKEKYKGDDEYIDFQIAKIYSENTGETKPSIYQSAYAWIYNFINILGDIEEFKVRLWNKKRKVIKQEYCISLGKIQEYESLNPAKTEIFKEILNNEKQIEEWSDMLLNNKFNKDIINTVKAELNSGTISIASSLVVDTKYFSKDSRLYETLRSRGDKKLYEDGTKLDGILIKSENYQGLNSFKDDYASSVDMFYVDPPYNTGNDGFPYKDEFRSSTRCSMMNDRLFLSKQFSQPHTSLFSSIDDNENEDLGRLFKDIFGERNVETVIREKTDGRNNKINNNAVSTSKGIHEYIKIGFIDRKCAEFGKIFRIPTRKQEYTNPDNDPRGNWMSGIISLEEAKSDPSSENYYTIPNALSPDVLKTVKEKFNVEIKKETTRERYISPKEFENLLLKNQIYIPKGGEGVPRIKIFVNQPKAFDFESIIKNIGTSKSNELMDYLNSRHVYGVIGGLGSMGKSLKNELIPLFGEKFHSKLETYTPKPLNLIKELLRVGTKSEGIVCDFFSGTGTTGIATLNLNQDENSRGNRKFILMELQDGFDEIMLPRFKRTITSDNWDDGTPMDLDGTGGFFTYLYLNQYEDRFSAKGYLSKIENEIVELRDFNIQEDTKISQIISPLNELKKHIYNIDDELSNEELQTMARMIYK